VATATPSEICEGGQQKTRTKKRRLTKKKKKTLKMSQGGAPKRWAPN